MTLREERRLKIYEKRVLRRIFRPKRDEILGWRKFHNEELHNLYSLPNIIKNDEIKESRWAGNAARMGRRGMHKELWWESQKGRCH
jgi:hypothetical protein